MIGEALRCSIITPEGQVYDDEVEFVVLPAHDGQLGVLRQRAPLVCKLGAGRLRIRTPQIAESWFIDGGFAQVLDNQVIVLTERALRPEEIDRSAAQRQLDAARQLRVTDDVSRRRRDKLIDSARAQLRMAMS